MIYTFGIPDYSVWGFHVLFGIFLVYIGYTMYKKNAYNEYLPISLMVLGVLAAVYHAHLFQYHKLGGKEEEQKRMTTRV